MIIDLRSDTFTKPTKDMLMAMMQAEVGDDVFREDPTVNRLEQETAAMFGMEASLFCPSGTMANQIAIKVNTEPMDEMICEKEAHIHYYEAGGAAFNSGVSAKLIAGERGKITANQVLESINKDDLHFPRTRLVALENTSNRGGGSIYSINEMAAISQVAKQKGLRLHLDGVRIFNALEALNKSPMDLQGLFDTITVCFSKGLGAPVGSVLLGSEADIYRARRIRKVLGGGMRQAGYLAAACLFALEHNIARIKEDHLNARIIGDALGKCHYVSNIYPVETNFIIFDLLPGLVSDKFLRILEHNGIKALSIAPQKIRFVTHLDISNEMAEKTAAVLQSISF